MPELFWWGVDGDDLITEAAELAPFEAEAAEAVALVAIVSSFNLLLGHPEIRKILFQKKLFKSPWMAGNRQLTEVHSPS